MRPPSATSRHGAANGGHLRPGFVRPPSAFWSWRSTGNPAIVVHKLGCGLRQKPANSSTFRKTTRARRCPPTPRRPTGRASASSEFLCASYARAYGLHATIARLFAFSGHTCPWKRTTQPATSSGTRWPEARCGLAATAPYALTYMRRIWRYGCGPSCFADNPVSLTTSARRMKCRSGNWRAACRRSRRRRQRSALRAGRCRGAPALRYVPATERAAELGVGSGPRKGMAPAILKTYWCDNLRTAPTWRDLRLARHPRQAGCRLRELVKVRWCRHDFRR